jgi:hydrogenase maturation protease
MGVGNTIMGDDGLGVHALRILSRRALPPGTEIFEAGTALATSMPDLSKYDKVIILDAIRNGNGLCVIRDADFTPGGGMSLHDAGLSDALAMAGAEKGRLPGIVIVGAGAHSMELTESLSAAAASQLPGIVVTVLNELEN